MVWRATPSPTQRPSSTYTHGMDVSLALPLQLPLRETVLLVHRQAQGPGFNCTTFIYPLSSQASHLHPLGLSFLISKMGPFNRPCSTTCPPESLQESNKTEGRQRPFNCQRLAVELPGV